MSNVKTLHNTTHLNSFLTILDCGHSSSTELLTLSTEKVYDFYHVSSQPWDSF